MKDGADIDTWLTKDGYLDYIIPQIYWSNQWGGGCRRHHVYGQVGYVPRKEV